MPFPLLRSVLSICLFSIFFVAGGAQQKELTFELSFVSCAKPPQLHQFNGFSFEPVYTAAARSEADRYTLTMPAGKPAFYYLGGEEAAPLPLILGSEGGLQFVGSCSNPSRTEISGSTLNEQYGQLKKSMNDIRQQFSQQLMAYRQAKTREAMEAAVADMQSTDAAKLALLDSARQVNALFGEVVALNTYLSFFHNNHGRYPNEIEYFANEYFKQADFSQPVYEHLPWVYEGFKNYAQTLSVVKLDADRHRAYLEGALSKTPAGSRTRQLAYGGVINVLEQRQHPNLVHFVESFLREFPDIDPAVARRLDDLLDRARAFSIGGVAPDFSQQTPDGESLRLSELRGKVVLVDFWASWCGPCRRENPNVVRMYNDYKDKGFEILGVSLDRDRERWLQAIEKDGLTWPHVSDLKGWQNSVAKAYGVHSIPHTVLLDEEGRIIARNLRGAALEKKLKELFGIN